MSQTRIASRTGKSPEQMTLTFDASAGPVPPPSTNGSQARAAAAAPRRERATRETAESMAKRQREISVSEFFAKNRHLLGFDNKRKALLTTVKEAVDNSLDACEEAGILPDLEVEITQVDEDRFRVRVRDNGPGIVKQQIPNIFGKLLYGSKFHRLKMSRGQQGIGISAAGMYGLLTTGKSIKITSRVAKKRDAHHYEIQIDTKKNDPTIVKDETVQVDWEHGTSVEIELVGSYNKGRQSVDEYLELTAIANPHARIVWKAPGAAPVEFARASNELPAHPLEIKPHPHGVELGILIKMLHDTKSHWLSGFLTSEFCRVGAKMAEGICKEAKLSPRAHPRRIARQEAETLYKAIQKTKLMSPPTNCLSPIGPQQLLSGLLKGVKAEFFAASIRPPAVYRGNPFQIEVGVAYGGELGPDVDPEAADAPKDEVVVRKGKVVSSEPQTAQSRIIRFANRVPLLYQQGACCTYKSVTDTDWRRYGLSQPGGGMPAAPLVIMVHMASVWVPFTSESKEAIADYDEIRKEIKLAMQDCGRKLQGYLNRRKRQKYEGERRSVFERYIGEVVNSCAAIKRINKAELFKHLTAISTRVTARADEELDDSGKVKKNGAAPALATTASEFGENTVVVERGPTLAPEQPALFSSGN